MKSIICFFIGLCLLPWTAFAQIQAGKTVIVTATGIPAEEKGRIEGNYPVSDSGTVNMPFIGSVRAAGLRNEDLARSLQNRFISEGYYTNITIQVLSSLEDTNVNQQMVHVGGFVRRPGPVPFVRGLTLYQAIQAAGGETEFGTIRRVRVFRGNSQKEYDVSQTQFMKIPLEPSDTIDVPQKNWIGR